MKEFNWWCTPANPRAANTLLTDSQCLFVFGALLSVPSYTLICSRSITAKLILSTSPNEEAHPPGPLMGVMSRETKKVAPVGCSALFGAIATHSWSIDSKPVC